VPIKKSYRQLGDGCRAANALDLVGDRWVLIIARELILGPKRFAELQEAVRGITPAVLSDRLRSMTDAGIIGQTTLAGEVPGYTATAWGRGLEQILQDLGRWYSAGPDLQTDGGMTPDAMVLAMRTMAPAAPPALPELWLRLYDSRRSEPPLHDYRAEATDDVLEIVAGPAAEPAATVTAESTSWADVLFGGLALADAERQGSVRIDGDRGPVERLVSLFS
jgi:DNA-binding HxlR family transcriptional regulator